MELEGNVKDDILTLSYVEHGKFRKTSGIFIVTMYKEFKGQFSQTASNTKGDIIGCKLER